MIDKQVKEDPDRFERIECEQGVLYINKNYEGPIVLDAIWGGSLRCMTSDGRNVNMAEELNRIENEG